MSKETKEVKDLAIKVNGDKANEKVFNDAINGILKKSFKKGYEDFRKTRTSSFWNSKNKHKDFAEVLDVKKASILTADRLSGPEKAELLKTTLEGQLLLTESVKITGHLKSMIKEELDLVTAVINSIKQNTPQLKKADKEIDEPKILKELSTHDVMKEAVIRDTSAKEGLKMILQNSLEDEYKKFRETRTEGKFWKKNDKPLHNELAKTIDAQKNIILNSPFQDVRKAENLERYLSAQLLNASSKNIAGQLKTMIEDELALVTIVINKMKADPKEKKTVQDTNKSIGSVDAKKEKKEILPLPPLPVLNRSAPMTHAFGAVVKAATATTPKAKPPLPPLPSKKKFP